METSDTELAVVTNADILSRLSSREISPASLRRLTFIAQAELERSVPAALCEISEIAAPSLADCSRRYSSYTSGTRSVAT